MYQSPQGPPISHSSSGSSLYTPSTPTRGYQYDLYQPRTPTMDPGLYAMENGPTSYSPSTTSHNSSPFPPSGGSTYAPRQPISPHVASQLHNQLQNLSTNGSPGMAGPSANRGISVIDFMAFEGSQGTQVTIKCEVNFAPSPPPVDPSSPSRSSSGGKALRLVFGTNPVPTKVSILAGVGRSGGQICQCIATAPSWSSTGSHPGGMNRVAVYVQALAETHAIVETVQVGNFTYLNTGHRGNTMKRSGENLDTHRPSPTSLHRRVVSGSFEPDQSYGIKGGYQGPDQQLQSPFHTQVPAPVQYAPDSGPLQPSLMRTTQLAPGIVHPAPYVTVGTKAKLELSGDLKSMAIGWSTEEWHCRRRLVQFWRRQEGTTIHAAFRPISQENYVQNSIVISCIFREDKNECFVTSVDAIYLLEALVGVRFTVEEKNRIRRNLEGFRPITVSKNKAGSEEFFKLIMGFPNPKPRNIEKDVKVFPWEIFGSALKKIIGKYSASYTFAPNGNMPSGQIPMPPQDYSVPPPMQPMGEYVPRPPPPIPHPNAHSSSDSSSSFVHSNHSYSTGPGTPQNQLQHSGSYGSVSAEEVPTLYRPHPGDPSANSHTNSYDEKHETYVNFSPEDTTFNGGYNQVNQKPAWSAQPGQEVSHPSPAISAASYATLPAYQLDQQPHSLPHVHQSLPRQPSSNDLRVMYPALG